MKRRTKRLTELFHSYETYSHKVDEVQEVLITEEAHDGIHYVGHNKFYEQVNKQVFHFIRKKIRTY